MAQNTTFHIPVVFDVSGAATLFAEETPDDFVENHLHYTLDARINDKGYTLTAEDISNSIFIDDRDNEGEILFYQSSEQGRTIIDLARKISQAITHGNLKNDIANLDKRVPIGGGDVVNGEATLYTGGLTDTAGNHLPECLARVMSTHLVGHPLAQAFIKDELALYEDISNNQEVQMVSQLNKLLGNDPTNQNTYPNLVKVSDAEIAAGVDVSGVSNIIFKSLFDQLMSVTQRASSARELAGLDYSELDADGFAANDNTLRGFPLIDGDKLVFYVRVKAHLSFETQLIHSVVDSQGDAINAVLTDDLTGLQAAGATAAIIRDVFPGGQNIDGESLSNTYGWMGHTGNAGKEINQQVTDETDSTIMDAHIWKITVTI